MKYKISKYIFGFILLKRKFHLIINNIKSYLDTNINKSFYFNYNICLFFKNNYKYNYH